MRKDMANTSKIIKLNCPACNKVAVETSRADIGDLIFVTLECGHTITQDKVKGSDYELVSSDNRSIRPFQIEGIKFAEESNARCLIADEPGLGKTIQALGMLKLHPELCPALVILKSKLKVQWFSEVIRWCGLDYLPQIIQDSKTPIIPGFKVYIIPFDLLRRLSPEKKAELQVKTVIIDECQQIKNHLSSRAKEVQGICKDVEHILCLSGTPIKNNAGEYFTVLNLLRPRKFPYYAEYIRKYCDAYDSGWGYKVGGLKNADWFQEDTKDFIIRRTWDEVDPEMPRVARNFFHVELDKKYEKIYQQQQEEMEEQYLKEQEEGLPSNPIALMAKLRHTVGFNKVEPTVEFVQDFILDTNKKIVIFTHHLDVTEVLKSQLQHMLVENNLPNIIVEHIKAGEAGVEAVARFESNPNARIAVASTLAAGEGLNMQFCSDIIIMERQWNPANEEQVEGRIKRIGQESKSLNGTYMIASGTIDEYFTELVEQKRAIMASTLDNKTIAWDENSLMKDLLEIVIAKGSKRWRLK